MILKTKNKEIILVFSTRKIVSIANLLKEKSFDDLYFKAVHENDLEALSKIIYIFAEDINGEKVFKNSEEVYDFFDDYKMENNQTYEDIFKEVAVAINDEGFFKRKKGKKELEEMILNPLSSINMNEIIKKSTERAIERITETEVTAHMD